MTMSNVVYIRMIYFFCKYVVDNMVKTFDGVAWSTRMMSKKDLDNIDECINLLQKIRETMVIDQ